MANINGKTIFINLELLPGKQAQKTTTTKTGEKKRKEKEEGGSTLCVH